MISHFDIIRVRPLNLGWCLLPSKVAPDTPFLSRLWANLAKTWVDFWSRVRSNMYQISAKLVDRRPRWRNFCRKKHKPKFKGRTLYRKHREIIELLLRCKKTDAEMLRYDDFMASFLSYFRNFPADGKFRRRSILDWAGRRANLIGLSFDAIESRERLIRDLGETCPNYS